MCSARGDREIEVEQVGSSGLTRLKLGRLAHKDGGP